MLCWGSGLEVTGAAKAEAANSERAAASARRFMGILRMWRVCGLARKGTRDRDLLDPSGFVEAQPWRTREDAGRVALAEVDEEVGLDGRAIEEGLVALRVVAARHRPGVEAERVRGQDRSEEHTSALQSLMRSSYVVFCVIKENSRLHNTCLIS